MHTDERPLTYRAEASATLFLTSSALRRSPRLHPQHTQHQDESEPPQGPRERLQECYRRYARDGIYFVASWGRTVPVLSVQRAYWNASNAKIIYVDEDCLPDLTPPWRDGWVVETESSADLRHIRFVCAGTLSLYGWVPFEDYCRPTLRERFPRTHVDAAKLEVNERFVKLLAQCDPSASEEIVFLDSPTACTTAMLVARGYARYQLHLPNPTENFAKRVRASARGRTQIYEATVYEFFRDLDPEDATRFHLGLDYCCTFEGNAYAVRPQEDLVLIFAKQRWLPNNGVLWLTFSARKAGPREAYLSKIGQWVETTAHTFGYDLALADSGSYRNLVYLFFRSLSTRSSS